MKEANKQTVVLSEAIIFDDQLIHKITFDLIHINHGWDDEKHDYSKWKRSSYTALDIIDLFEQLKYFKLKWVLGINKVMVKIKGSLYYRYLWKTTDEEGNIVRVVLDLAQKKTGEGIIVTVFRP